MALSLALLALAPEAPVLAVASGALFGSAYNLLVAIQCLWSVRVFAERPGTGVAAVMLILGGGLLIGPLAAGPLAAGGRDGGGLRGRGGPARADGAARAARAGHRGAAPA